MADIEIRRSHGVTLQDARTARKRARVAVPGHQVIGQGRGGAHEPVICAAPVLIG